TALLFEAADEHHLVEELSQLFGPEVGAGEACFGSHRAAAPCCEARRRAMWMASPSTVSAASLMASASVGCACTAKPTSTVVASRSAMSDASPSRSFTS